MVKNHLDPYPNIGAFGIGDFIPDQGSLITTDGTERTYSLQNSTYQVEIKNKAFFEGTAYTGRARISVYAGGTADSGSGGNSGKYILLESGESVILDVATNETIYYRRDDTADIALDIRERRL